MTNFFKKNQIILFSLLTLLWSLLAWYFADGTSGTTKILLNQLGIFGPAIIAVLLTVMFTKSKKDLQLSSFLPFIVIVLCILFIAFRYGESYYNSDIAGLLAHDPLAIIVVSIAVAYFIFRFAVNKGRSPIGQLVNINKTNVLWYILAITVYPLIKYGGTMLSLKLFPDQTILRSIEPVMLVPLFVFAIVFSAGIGEEVGWRGYALRELQKKYNPFKASLFIFIYWTFWHFGYFLLVENWPVHTIPSIILLTLVGSFMFTWFFNKTNGNVLVVILLHASVNFAMFFVPHPIIMFSINILILIIVFSTGRFFKKIQIENSTRNL